WTHGVELRAADGLRLDGFSRRAISLSAFLPLKESGFSTSSTSSSAGSHGSGTAGSFTGTRITDLSVSRYTLAIIPAWGRFSKLMVTFISLPKPVDIWP